MAKYRRKDPVEAVQWTGKNDKAVGKILPEGTNVSPSGDGHRLYINSTMSLVLGNWLVVDGGPFSVVSDRIFRSKFIKVVKKKK